ncbi:MAG: hypothetical protein ACTHLD_09525 [Chitinophaga sp.]
MSPIVDKIILTLCIMGLSYPVVLLLCHWIRFSWRLNKAGRLIKKSRHLPDLKQRRAYRLKALDILEQLAIEAGL